jgi:NAD(P) transhydrogenase subunit alpha
MPRKGRHAARAALAMVRPAEGGPLIVGVLREIEPGERRVALVPEGVKVLVKAGLEVRAETGAGAAAGFGDGEYEAAGARVEDGAALRGAADVLLKVQPPSDAEVAELRPGSALVALLRPLDDPQRAARLAERGVTAFSLELVPRITRAQAMDVLSSQATVAGYRAVLVAAERLPKMFPLLTTAAGTLVAARVFVIGAGVAGLQAIATSRRLGAVVEAYDTRPAVAEQVRSLGAKFVELELAAGDAEDKGGYATAQSEEFYARQRKLMGERAARSDVVVTTALVPGQRAPLLLDEDGVRAMRAGSVVVDLAAANGGNCACTVPGETVVRHGVTLVGDTNLASAIPRDASQMFSKNAVTFLLNLVKDGALHLDLEDEITRGSLVTRDGQVVNEAVRSRL